MNITHHKNGEIKTLVEEAPYHPGYEDAGFKPSPIKSRVNELADWILDEVRHADEAEEIATMLRQQQAEIKTLEGALAQLKHMNKNWQISENILLLELEKLQSRELTDEEILQVMMNVYSDTVPPIRGIEFARAILRKAQEK